MSTSTEKRLAELRAEYEALAHAVQSGIAHRMEREDVAGTVMRDPGLMRALKHLRVGIDTSKSDQGGLAGLLISKGLITELEYFEAVVTAMRREKESYERMLSEMFGANITLG